jgi:hypothetical protein
MVRPEKAGPLIGAAFGRVFVLVNTGSVPTAIGVLLRVVAVAAFLAVLVTVGRSRASASDLPTTVRVPGGGFSRGYWLVVAGEVAAAVVELVVLNTVLHAPQAAVAWISAVVGVHFVALAAVWKLASLHGLCAPLLLCGVVGLVLAATGSPPARSTSWSAYCREPSCSASGSGAHARIVDTKSAW